MPSGASFAGPQGYLQFLEVWGRAFPDAQIEIRNVCGGEDWAVAEFVGRGTHSGPLSTPMGEVPATGKPIDLAFCEVYRLKGGKISSCDLYFDAATMMRQLGLVG